MTTKNKPQTKQPEYFKVDWLHTFDRLEKSS